MSRHLTFAALTLALTLAACGERSDVTGPVAPINASMSVDPARDQGERLARGVALALAKPQLRAQLRNAMRDSRWTDHKLVLQQYVDRPDGRQLVAEAAAALGATQDALRATVRALPVMDFYVPFREHRLAWRGSPDVLVAAVFDGDAPTITAFDSKGVPHTLRLADGVPARPLVILSPEEPKGVRPSSELRGTGDVIQYPNESGVLSGVRLSGVSGLAPLLSMETGCDQNTALTSCESESGGGGGAYIQPGVYITQFDAHRGDGWFGSLEMQWRSYFFTGRPEWLGGDTWFYQDRFPQGTAYRTIEGHGYDNQLMLLSPGITNVSSVGGGYELHIVEIDGGLNLNDDDFGRRFFVPTFPAGALPWDAAVGRAEDYYSNAGTPDFNWRLPDYEDAQRSMTVTLQYRK